jgi:hypothetical protein
MKRTIRWEPPPESPHGPVVLHVCHWCGAKRATYVGRYPRGWHRGRSADGTEWPWLECPSCRGADR